MLDFARPSFSTTFLCVRASSLIASCLELFNTADIKCHESSAKSAQDQPHLKTTPGGLVERSAPHVNGQKAPFSRNLLSGK